MSLSFKNFKKEFYSKFTDFRIFEGKEFNYFKIALEGLKVDYFYKGKFSTSIFFPSFKYYIFYLLNRLKKIINEEISRFNLHLEISKKNKQPEYLIIDPGRYVKNSKGDLVPIYFSKIYQSLKKKHSVFYVSEKKIYDYNDFNDTYSDLKSLGNSIKHYHSKELRLELKKVFINIKNNSNFSSEDLENIKCSFQKFYNEAIFWLNILDSLRPKSILMICHYHKEGLIFAAKKFGINVIEYQHGLIAKSDIFYNFPIEIKEIKKDCLFPNEIRTYGKYWSNVLLNGNFLNKEKIKVVKYFFNLHTYISKKDKKDLKSFVNNRKIILVTTQTYLSENFIMYIDSLVEVLDKEYCIVIKPHPNEKIEFYNKYLKNCDVLISNVSTEFLLNVANLHVTIYSSTAFDALRYNISTFFIYCENQIDYINEIQEIIGGKILYDYKIKPWKLDNKLTVNSKEFFYL